jgi:hypothetical protein
MAHTLWPGTVGPLETTPPRRERSVRRTVTVDGHRPDGPRGDVVVSALGRDLVTSMGGAAEVRATEQMELRADFVTDQRVKSLVAEPGDEGLRSLVGLPSRRGFRGAMARNLPDRHNDGSLLIAMLDDVPIVTSLSRMALRQRGAVSAEPGDPTFLGNRGDDGAASAWGATFVVECAGWAPGTTLSLRAAGGQRTPINDGFPSPPVLDPGDPLGWHHLEALPPDGFRRWRRTDVWRDPDDAESVRVDSWWRDSYVADDNSLMIVHEYSIAATVDARTGVISSCVAVPHVLPAPECPTAAASVAWVIGQPANAIGPTVRREVAGFSSCTHLTDELRAFSDVHALVELLP